MIYQSLGPLFRPEGKRVNPISPIYPTQSDTSSKNDSQQPEKNEDTFNRQKRTYIKTYNSLDSFAHSVLNTANTPAPYRQGLEGVVILTEASEKLGNAGEALRFRAEFQKNKYSNWISYESLPGRLDLEDLKEFNLDEYHNNSIEELVEKIRQKDKENFCKVHQEHFGEDTENRYEEHRAKNLVIEVEDKTIKVFRRKRKNI